MTSVVTMKGTSVWKSWISVPFLKNKLPPEKTGQGACSVHFWTFWCGSNSWTKNTNHYLNWGCTSSKPENVNMWESVSNGDKANRRSDVITFPMNPFCSLCTEVSQTCHRWAKIRQVKNWKRTTKKKWTQYCCQHVKWRETKMSSVLLLIAKTWSLFLFWCNTTTCSQPLL